MDETVGQFTAETNKIAGKYADVYLDCTNLKFRENMLKNGVVVKLTSINPDAAG